MDLTILTEKNKLDRNHPGWDVSLTSDQKELLEEIDFSVKLCAEMTKKNPTCSNMTNDQALQQAQFLTYCALDLERQGKFKQSLEMHLLALRIYRRVFNLKNNNFMSSTESLFYNNLANSPQSPRNQQPHFDALPFTTFSSKN